MFVLISLTQVQQKVSFYHVDVWGKAKANSHTSFIPSSHLSVALLLLGLTLQAQSEIPRVYQNFPHSSLNFITAVERRCSSKKPQVNTKLYCAAYRSVMQISCV